MIANYHTHTPRCNHATGTEREYAQSAMQRGLKVLGFSDHSPYLFPEGYYSGFRMRPEQLNDYTAAVMAVRDEYAGQLEILCGLELEYYPRFFAELLSVLKDTPVEYLLLGQHFVGNEIGDHYSGIATEDEQILQRYCAQTMEAMNTGLFTYFAHPDLIRYTGDHKIYIKHIRALCREAKSCNIPLEINLLGVMNGRHYPNSLFWEVAAEESCDVILGCDAHFPDALLDMQSEEKGIDLAKQYGLNVLNTVQIRSIHELL